MNPHSIRRGGKARRKASQSGLRPTGERQALPSGPADPRGDAGPAASTFAALASYAADESPADAGPGRNGANGLNGANGHVPAAGAVPAQAARAEAQAEAHAGAPAGGRAQSPVAAPPRESAPPAPAPPAEDESERAPRFARLRRLGAGMRANASATARRIRAMTLYDWAWVGVIALAFALRVWGIGDKPLHHDESMHAFYSYMFARDPAGYVYDPLLHGPFQFHAAGVIFGVIVALEWVFRVGGPAGNPWINDATARIAPLLFGTAIVILPLGLRRELGRIGALLAAVLLAVSPSFVYFSRFLREDIYFNFFMFAMVVCAVRFARERETRWLVGLFAAAVCAYATFEGIFLTLAIFVGFLAVLLAWELGLVLARALPTALSWRERIFFSRTGLLLLLGAVGSSLALFGLTKIHEVGSFATAHQQQADAAVAALERNTVAVVLWASIAVAILVIALLFWQMLYEPSAAMRQLVAERDDDEDEEEEYYDTSPRPRPNTFDRIDLALGAPGRWLARRRAALDPERQFVLWTLAGTQWVQWFVAAVVAWVAFAALFWVIPGGQAQTWGDGFQIGVGKGIWQGLYYWATQQDVARGGQPIYYYFLLIPLYEQLAVVFGLAGAAYALFRPNRFRLFLVVWFLGSLALYSWAGEKMPWLTIQILLPLMLLAAIALDVVVRQARILLASNDPAHFAGLHHALGRSYVAIFGSLAAILLLIPMVHSMWVLSHQDAADGPREMMVYVQTTTDVTSVMSKINAADQKLYGGKHQLKIAVGQQEEWPFYWYLRDYYLDNHPSTYVYWEYPVSDASAPREDVLLLLPSDAETFMAQHPTGYTMHQYKLRSWWDEAYKPRPGDVGPSQYANTGVGLGPYLSYGSNPPPNATFDAGRAARRVWRWMWLREPLGSTDGSFDFTLVVRDGVPIQLPQS